MCRYAMSIYKGHYACFHCRKTFKRRLMWDITRGDETNVPAKCPQCGALMANMGMDFASPKMADEKAWKHIETLYSVGITFHSCGCTGPGYIPKTTEMIIKHFEDTLTCYRQHLTFWRNRIMPTNKREVDRENSKYGGYIYAVPYEVRAHHKVHYTEEAKQYWLGKIKSVEQKIELLRKQA